MKNLVIKEVFIISFGLYLKLFTSPAGEVKADKDHNINAKHTTKKCKFVTTQNLLF